MAKPESDQRLPDELRAISAREIVDQNQPMLTPDDAAQMVGMTKEQLLARVRRGRGPRAYKLGQRTIRFARQDIDAWLEKRAR